MCRVGRRRLTARARDAVGIRAADRPARGSTWRMPRQTCRREMSRRNARRCSRIGICWQLDLLLAGISSLRLAYKVIHLRGTYHQTPLPSSVQPSSMHHIYGMCHTIHQNHSSSGRSSESHASATRWSTHMPPVLKHRTLSIQPARRIIGLNHRPHHLATIDHTRCDIPAQQLPSAL